MSEEVKSYAGKKVSTKPNETQVLVFSGSSAAVQHYHKQIEDLRKKGITVWVIVNEEIASPRLRTPAWTYIGKAELNRFLGIP
jgi:histidyl-tRNA synthetase